jgi:purine-binding chemotaxis protein CheW
MSDEIKLTTNSYLTFKLREETFAVSVSKVLEILEIPQITKVPQTPEYMRGVLNLRGNVLPVIDTRLRFGMDKADDSVNSCIIVLKLSVDGEEVVLGAVVDSVQEVLEINDESITPPPSIGNKYKSEFIKGMGKINDHFIMILDIDLVFSVNELSILKDANVSESI